MAPIDPETDFDVDEDVDQDVDGECGYCYAICYPLVNGYCDKRCKEAAEAVKETVRNKARITELEAEVARLSAELHARTDGVTFRNAALDQIRDKAVTLAGEIDRHRWVRLKEKTEVLPPLTPEEPPLPLTHEEALDTEWLPVHVEMPGRRRLYPQPENNAAVKKPVIGDVVHYQAYGTPGGEHTSEPRAAIITEILSDEEVGVCVLNPTGVFFNRVKLVVAPTPGCANYA
jgi:hypothetical protein